MHDRRAFGVHDTDHAAAEYFERVLLHADRGVLVDPDTESLGIERDRAEQTGESAALGEVHIDQHPGDEAEAWSGPYGRGRHLSAVAAQDHRPAEGGRTRARSSDHQSLGQQGAELLVDPGTNERTEPGLVTAAEEDTGSPGQCRGRLGTVGTAPAADPQFLHLPDAELAEYLLVLGAHRARTASCGRDQNDPGAGSAAELDEALQRAGAAAPVLGTADDQQTARNSPVIHVLILIPDRDAAPDAVSTRRYCLLTRSHGGPGRPDQDRGFQPPNVVPEPAILDPVNCGAWVSRTGWGAW